MGTYFRLCHLYTFRITFLFLESILSKQIDGITKQTSECEEEIPQSQGTDKPRNSRDNNNTGQQVKQLQNHVLQLLWDIIFKYNS